MEGKGKQDEISDCLSDVGSYFHLFSANINMPLHTDGPVMYYTVPVLVHTVLSPRAAAWGADNSTLTDTICATITKYDGGEVCYRIAG